MRHMWGAYLDIFAHDIRQFLCPSELGVVWVALHPPRGRNPELTVLDVLERLVLRDPAMQERGRVDVSAASARGLARRSHPPREPRLLLSGHGDLAAAAVRAPYRAEGRRDGPVVEVVHAEVELGEVDESSGA